MTDDQLLRVKALEMGLATETGGSRRDMPAETKNVMTAAEIYYAFLAKPPATPS